jgi:hypothetical protein
MSHSLRIAGFLLCAASSTLGAQRGKPVPGEKPPPPLSPMASQHVMVLPAQVLRADSGAWIGPMQWEKFRHELDDSIGSIIAARGIGKTWKYASDVARIAKRNPDYVNDPYSMGVQPMLAAMFKINDPLPISFSSNLRTIIALAGARYALVPMQVWFVTRNGLQIAAVKLALADGQGGTIVWLGDVGTDPATTMPPDLINTLATRIANLIVAP